MISAVGREDDAYISSIFDEVKEIKRVEPRRGGMVETLLLKADRIFISHLTITEMASALAKKVSMGDLKKEKETLLWNSFLDDMQTEKIELIPLDERHYLKAADFIRELREVDSASRPLMPFIYPLHTDCTPRYFYAPIQPFLKRRQR